MYNNKEGDAVLINSNYAIDAKLNPEKDAIAIESNDSPYANVVAVRKGDKDKKEIKALVEVLHSKEIEDFINKEYKGAVVPVKNNCWGRAGVCRPFYNYIIIREKGTSYEKDSIVSCYSVVCIYISCLRRERGE